MAEYIDREALKQDIRIMPRTTHPELVLYPSVQKIISNCPTVDVVEVVRCKDCIHAVELDKHCDINRTAYKHCTLLRGDETKYVWHKYKKYYKDYSIVEPNDFCSYGIKRGEENAKEKE